jgi:hypothetical protein
MRRTLPLLPLAAGALCAALLGACKDTTSPHPPAQLQPASAITVAGTVSQPLADSVAVRIADSDGFPLAGVQVTWQPGTGSGSVSPATSTTGADGIARTRWTLGTVAGTQTLTVSVAGVTPSLMFTVTAAPGPAASVVVTPSPALLLLVGEQATLTARLYDAYGNLVGPATNASWSSADAQVVETTGAAALIGRRVGTARVTATVAGVGSAFTDVTVRRPTIVSLSEGANQAVMCAMDDGANAYCWGDSGYDATGQAGGLALRPVLVGGGLRWAKVSTSGALSCGLLTSGEVRCWGLLNSGVYAPVISTTPQPATGLPGPVTDVAAGARLCVISNGALYCWNSYYNNGPTLASGGTFTAVSASGSEDCARASTGIPWCVGENTDFQLGRDQTGCTALSAPREYYCNAVAPATSPQTYTRVRTGEQNTCGVDAAGSWYCWGRADFNLLQQPEPAACRLLVTQFRYADTCTKDPVAMSTTPPLVQLYPGYDAVCGLSAAGQAYCWGAGNHGQLGNGSTADNPAPTPVAGGHTFTRLAAGREFFCGLDGAGQVWCWGRNDAGQLGDGTTTERTTPVAVF